MGKDKLRRFSELETFHNVFQPPFDEVFNKSYHLKGQWKQSIFLNDHPLVLELGCGKGEYTLGLAREYPNNNFIGVDIKGARMWRGAKEAIDNHINNVAFVRARIEVIVSFFNENEVDEIWVTFPDPQPGQRRKKKRLTSAGFLNKYRHFLIDNGMVHLKTDSRELYDYTMALLQHNNLEVIYHTSDLYHSGMEGPVVQIRTFYEQMFLNEGKPITYIKFRLLKDKQVEEIDEG